MGTEKKYSKLCHLINSSALKPLSTEFVGLFFGGNACYRPYRTRQHLKTIRLMGNID